MPLRRSVLVGGALVGVTLATASCSSSSPSTAGNYKVTVSLAHSSGRAVARVQRLERANGGHATFLDTAPSNGKTIVEFPDLQHARAFTAAIKKVDRLRVVSVAPVA
jgi:hypothetical protein